MFLKKLRLTNFKGFKGDHVVVFNGPDGMTKGSGLNILVGENNTGKSSVFEAIYFLRNGKKDDVKSLVYRGAGEGADSLEMCVVADFSGRLDEVIETYAEKKANVYSGSIFEEDGARVFRVKRGCVPGSCVEKNIYIFNPGDNAFQNPSGIDAAAKGLFELFAIWADTNPQNEAQYSASTFCGGILKKILKDYGASEEYSRFEKEYEKLFNNDGSDFRSTIKSIEAEINSYFGEQFASQQVKFLLDKVNADTFFKNIALSFVDDDRTTNMKEEGMGLQRVVSLALLQVYAKLVSQEKEKNISKPFILFIDEPELCLHPLGQRKLLDSLLEISKNQQIFIATHSPFFLQGDAMKNAALIICNKEKGINRIKRYEKYEKIFPWSPSWGEICYKAYNLPTIEFHNELYGQLQALSTRYTEKDFEKWLGENSVEKSIKWIREEKGKPLNNNGNMVTLQTYIRNKIHHPENLTMAKEKISTEQMMKSIQTMVDLLTRMRNGSC